MRDLPLNQILHGDCFALLPTLPDHSVDLVLTDPPFGTTACRWDDDLTKLRMGDRTALQVLFDELRRVVKTNGAILICAQQPFATACINTWRKGFRYEWVWEKALATGFLNSNRMPLRAHELVLVFYEKLPFWGHVNAWTGEQVDVPAGHDYIYGHRGSSGRRSEKLHKPRSVVRFAQEKRPNDPYRHPTRKPQALFELMIRSYTRPGEVVLDPFVGSGTTAAAALATGRRFVAMERDAEYAEKASKRKFHH